MSLFAKFSGATRIFNYKNTHIDLETDILKIGLREIQLESAQQSNLMALLLYAAAKDENPSIVTLAKILGENDRYKFAHICSGLMGVLEKCLIANDCGNMAGFYEESISADALIIFDRDGLYLNKPLADAIDSSHEINEETLYNINHPAAQVE